MDIQPQTTQPISDDQELAKVLAGVSDQADTAADTSTMMPAPTMPPVPMPPTPAPAVDPAELSSASAQAANNPQTDSSLDGIKQEALGELRPLVDKLNVSPEEKFDTYLLLIRSTDDKTLIAPAHEAAKAIQDETRRADALLDIIKEIDYLSNPQ